MKYIMVRYTVIGFLIMLLAGCGEKTSKPWRGKPTAGTWKGRSESNNCWIAITFEVDESGSSISKLKYEYGLTGEEKYAVAFFPKGGSCSISNPASFRCVDSSGGMSIAAGVSVQRTAANEIFVEGRFISDCEAEGTVGKSPCNIGRGDGELKEPPIHWRARIK